jgi:hypothetical protein
MDIRDYPNLLVISKLVKPIERSTNSIHKWRERIRPETDEVFLSGILVMSVASMECMISDVLTYYLKNFPQKLPSSEFNYDKEEFFEHHFRFLDKAIEDYVVGLSYKSFPAQLNKFLGLMSVEWEQFEDTFDNQLQEIKKRRNSLLHDSPDDYDYSEAEARTRPKPQITSEYVRESTRLILGFEDALKERLLSKYSSYTKINANKKLWAFMFSSPIMLYEDYWSYDESKDSISAYKKGPYEQQISHSEAALLGLWRNHFTGTCEMKEFNMKLFDGTNRQKVLFFLSITGDFEFY